MLAVRGEETQRVTDQPTLGRVYQPISDRMDMAALQILLSNMLTFNALNIAHPKG
jgi:hypothetical protein